MDTIRVVLLDGSSSFLRAVEDYLGSHREIRITGASTDGRTGLRLIRREQPDVVLLGLVLQGLDGFSVMREARRLTHPPSMIVCAELYNDPVIRSAAKYGAAYFLCRPVEMHCIHHAILDCFSSSRPAPLPGAEATAGGSSPSSAEIRRFLAAQGISPRYTGSRYIAEALLLALATPVCLANLSHGVYADIAERHRVSPASVERCIRLAVCTAYSSGLLAFGTRPPSNREFLRGMLKRLQEELALKKELPGE